MQSVYFFNAAHQFSTTVIGASAWAVDASTYHFYWFWDSGILISFAAFFL